MLLAESKAWTEVPVTSYANKVADCTISANAVYIFVQNLLLAFFISNLAGLYNKQTSVVELYPI
jgi:hypothetical protein